MTTDELRRELDRVAGGAPTADVPDDTWTRARRSLLRNRVAVGGAALAVVAATAGGFAWVPDRGEPPVADSSSGAIPSRLWTVPSEQELEVRTDLAVGPVSAAYLDFHDSGDARAVAVSAATGRYVSLVLPSPDEGAYGGDAVSFGFEDQLLSLSPDGRQLAYSVFPSNGGGVAVIDLVDGTVRQIPLAFQRGGFVRTLTWSPGGRYLLWWGQPSFAGTAAGLIGPGATTSTPLPAERENETRGYAVDDNGQVALVDRNRIRTWQSGRIVKAEPVDLGSTWSASAQLVGGDLVEVRSPYPSDEMTGEEQTTVVRHSGGSVRSGALAESFVNRMSVLGWTSTGAVVVEADPAMGKTSEPDLYRVELSDDGTATPERIVTLESSVPPDALTVAADLPVEELDDPGWAEEPWWDIDRSLLIGLGFAGAIAALTGLRWGRRRYRAARYAS